MGVRDTVTVTLGRVDGIHLHDSACRIFSGVGAVSHLSDRDWSLDQGDHIDRLGALVISTVDNLLRPKLVGGQTRLHELLVFFAVLGGISVFGLLGIVLGPVVLAITLGLLRTFQIQPPPPASDSV